MTNILTSAATVTSAYPKTAINAQTNFNNFVIQNDWPILQGDWRAELDPATGKTIYIQNSNNKTLMVNGEKYSGPINLYGGNLTIKNGATVDSAELIAATNNPYITINSGGTLSNSNVYNGYVYIKSGGLSEGNFYVSEAVYIYSDGVSQHDTFCEPGTTSRTIFKNPNLSGGQVNNVLAGDGTSCVNLYSGGSLENPSFPNILENNKSAQRVKLELSQGSSYNLPDDYVAKNYNGVTYTNDWPYVGKSGGCDTWTAVLDTTTGKTIFKDPKGNTLLDKNGNVYSGPVNIVTNLVIKNGATVDGSLMVADGNNPTLTIENGGTLSNSNVYNGYLKVNSGGVSENNTYVSEAATINGKSSNDTFVNPPSTSKGYIINNTYTGGSGKFLPSDNVHSLNIGSNATIENIHIDESGCGICVYLPGDETGGCDACWPKVVSTGQTLSNHTIVQSCTLSVYGSAFTTTISGGDLYTYSGSFLSNVNADSGNMIASGGTITNAIINSNASALFTTGDTNVTGLTINGATVTLTDSATASNTVINNGGQEYISTGVVDTGATVLDGGKQFVAGTSGTFAYANSATISTGGEQTIYDWARATDLTLAGGTVKVSAGGGIIGDVNFISGGTVSIYAGAGVSTALSNGAKEVVGVNGAAHDTVITDATQIVQRKGVANNNTVNSGGLVAVRSGGTVNGATINSAGTIKISGGTINDAIINGGGKEYVYSGGIDNNAIINDGGEQFISGVAATSTITYASNTTVSSGGQQTVYNFGNTENVTLDGGALNVSAGGGITGNVNFTSSGTVNVYSGASVSTTISNGGEEYIYNGGVTTNTVISNGTQYVMSGGKSLNTVINSGGVVYVNTKGSANSVTINSGGKEYVYSGGTTVNNTINNGGEIVLSNGALGGITTINSGGVLEAFNGSATATNVFSGGTLSITGGLLGTTHVFSGASLYTSGSISTTGELRVDSGAYLNGELQLSTITSLPSENLFAVVYNNSNNTSVISQNNSSSTGATLQVGSMQSRDLQTPETYDTALDTSTDKYPMPDTDPDGNEIFQWTTYVTSAQVELNMQGYSYYDDLFTGYITFIPPGGDQSDRVWGVNEMLDNVGTSNGLLIPTIGSGSIDNKSYLMYDGAYQKVQATDFTNTIYVASTATLNADNSGASFNNIVLYNGGKLNATEGSINNVEVSSGGIANFSDNAKVTGILTIASAGSATFVDPATLDGATLNLENGGNLHITTSTGGTISLEGTSNSGLVITGSASTGGTTVASTIDNFDGNDTITLEDIQRSDVTGVTFGDADHITITLKDGSSITLNIPGIENTGYSLGTSSDGSIILETCFLSGTSISMLSGLINVEDIQVGEIIQTFDWKTNQTINSTVSWVGHKHMNVKTHLSDDLAGYPVRVLKNAISENVPNEDLLITPEHCLFFNDSFIPARMLVNGRSIYYDHSITSYDYYHIETDQHSVIWANGMLTESYLDTGNKNVFSNGQKVVSLFSNVKSWEKDAAAPLNVCCDVVKSIYQQINERAINANVTLQVAPLSLTTDPNLYLLTELGEIIRPCFSNNKKYTFNIPEGVNIVNLISRTSRPCDTIGSFIDDRRELGVLVGDIFIINNNGMYEITDHLLNPKLSGWDVVEQSSCRWTNGKASLNIYTSYVKNRILVINILAAGPYIEKENIEERFTIAL